MAESQQSSETPSGTTLSAEDIRKIQLEPRDRQGAARHVDNRYICEIPPGQSFKVPGSLVAKAIIHNWFKDALVKPGVQSQIARHYEKKL